MLQGRCCEKRRAFHYIKTWVRCVPWYNYIPVFHLASIPKPGLFVLIYIPGIDGIVNGTLSNNRLGHQAPEDVLSCCQESLQYLQLDYLDLYLIHVPFAVRKTASFPNFTEEDKLYYSAEAASKTWAVSIEFNYKRLIM